MGPTGVQKSVAMRKHRNLLRKIVVVFGVKTKTTIVRR